LTDADEVKCARIASLTLAMTCGEVVIARSGNPGDINTKKRWINN